MKPLAVDLYAGKGGWAHGLLATGWRVRGYDIADMGGYPGELVLGDVLALTGADLADADLIVASPPCQFFSYTAMPWTRAKKLAAEVRGCFGRLWRELRLFRACFRLRAEAEHIAGRPIPLVVENVCGAQPWVGRAKWHFGSYYLWGDVPAIMPFARGAQKRNPDGTDHGPGSGFAVAHSKNRGSRSNAGLKRFVHDWGDAEMHAERGGHGSVQRAEWSARIAMIRFPLARWIGECYYPADAVSVRTAKALCMEVLT